MPSSGMLRRMALVITDVSEELSETSVLIRAIRRNIPEDVILKQLFSLLNYWVEVASSLIVLKHHKSHMTWPGLEPGPRLSKAGE
jgi:hypothetical protein